MLGTYEPQDQRPGGQPNILPHLPKSSSPQMYKQRIGYNQGDQSAEDFMSPKIRRLLSRRPTAPLDFCPKPRLHALALGHLTSSEKTIRSSNLQLLKVHILLKRKINYWNIICLKFKIRVKIETPLIAQRSQAQRLGQFWPDTLAKSLDGLFGPDLTWTSFWLWCPMAESGHRKSVFISTNLYLPREKKAP